MTIAGPPCLLSIHDVMPETLDRVDRILHRLELLGPPCVTLLVVPGKAWKPDQIDRLRRWENMGHELAAHGWHHQVMRIGGVFHWLHARLISRHVAEHLALDSRGIADLIERSVAWFEQQGLATPHLYVPPAWALGHLSTHDRTHLPCRSIEVTRGLLDTATGRIRTLPLVGFEADTAWRRLFVFGWNAVQVRLARQSRVPLRFSLHPDDLHLGLRNQLEHFLAMPWRFCRYDEIGQ